MDIDDDDIDFATAELRIAERLFGIALMYLIMTDDEIAAWETEQMRITRIYLDGFIRRGVQ